MKNKPKFKSGETNVCMCICRVVSLAGWDGFQTEYKYRTKERKLKKKQKPVNGKPGFESILLFDFIRTGNSSSISSSFDIIDI